MQRLTEQELAAELKVLGGDFALDPATAWSVTSCGGTIVAAGVHHGVDRCGPRRYVARSASKVTWFDGLPVESEGRFRG